MAILFMSTRQVATDTYVPLLKNHLPDQDFRVWPDEMGDPADIEYAVIDIPDSGVLGSLPNLKAVLSLWAGVDGLLADSGFPRDIPLARMVDPLLAVDMTQFAIHWTLHFHRGLHHFAELQRAKEWRQILYPEASQRRVGVMGLGVLGTDAATNLSAMGFDVAGWDAIAKSIDGVETFVGANQLGAFLKATEILIILLPLTDETRGIMNAQTIAMLPQGAFLISLARGAHIVDEDLLAALDSGQVERALLDAFNEEPLGEDHPFWTHPGVVLTPHVASRTTPRTAAAEIAIDLRRLLAGEAPRHLVDVNRGF